MEDESPAKRQRLDTPEVEQIIVQAETSEAQRALVRRKHEQKHAHRMSLRDVAEAQRFLEQRRDQLREERLARLLLAKKARLDNRVGLESESESEDEAQQGSGHGNENGESYEDLLEMFGFDPDEEALEIGVNERQRLLMESMDEEQQTRYETFRRSNLNINGIKRLVNGATGINVPNDFAKIIAGVGKVFVGEIVEKAKDIQRKEAEAKVAIQLKYLADLQRYELDLALGDVPEAVPEVPTFYSSLNPESLGVFDSTSFRVVVPELDDQQLTPEEIRKAFFEYQKERPRVARSVKLRSESGTLFR